MITLHLYYTGSNGAARGFAKEMTRRGVVEAIRAVAECPPGPPPADGDFHE